MLKIIIGLAYFNRPKMVINALKSIQKANEFYENWELAFLDDSSSIPGQQIVKNFPDIYKKTTFYNSNVNYQQKKDALTHFIIANQALKETNADIAVVLCDDDALYPDYLLKLNNFFTNNPVKSCYSDMVMFDPLEEDYDYLYKKYLNNDLIVTSAYDDNLKDRRAGDHGAWCGAGKMDACQVAWRVSCNKDYNVWWPPGLLKDHDFYFFEQLARECGQMIYSGAIAQFKGHHKKQLGTLFNQVDNIISHKVDIDC